MYYLQKLCLLLIAAVVVSGRPMPDLSSSGAQTHDQGPRSKEAYVTLLYGDKFLLGVRTLGQSLRDSDTTRDMVVIAAGELSQYAIDTLEGDGWRVKVTPAVQNPNMRSDRKYPPRFWAVYTKLNVFGMTEYNKVVFLDADTIVVSNMDDIFKCPGFCACLRHSERFNSGVMVIKPSEQLFTDITNNIARLPSYTGGDQGFLNAYFEGFIDGPLFDPSKDYSASTNKYMRLPTRYNADMGFYVLNSNRWLLDGELKNIHYTLGAFKPWDWWCGWLIEEQSRWVDFRMRLPPDALGRRHGVTSAQAFAQTWLPFVPLLVAGLVIRYAMTGWPPQLAPIATWFPNAFYQMDAPPTVLSVAVGYASVLISVLVVGFIVPSTVTPTWGWILLFEYFFLGLFLLFGKYLQFCWLCGRVASGGQGLSSRAFIHQRNRTLIQAGLLTVLLLAAPFYSTILQIPGLVPKILLTVAGAVIANTVATYSFVSLAEGWYAVGKGDGKGELPTRR